MKVKLLVNTAYNGPKKKGDEFDVPEVIANRWVKNKIAEVIEEDDPVGDPVVEPDEDVDYASMNAKELYLVCKEKGLEVEAKKSKEYYLEMLA